MIDKTKLLNIKIISIYRISKKKINYKYRLKIINQAIKTFYSMLKFLPQHCVSVSFIK